MLIVMIDQVEWKMRRERPSINYITNVINASGQKMQEMVHKSRVGKRWHDLTSYRGAPYVDIGEGER